MKKQWKKLNQTNNYDFLHPLYDLNSPKGNNHFLRLILVIIFCFGIGIELIGCTESADSMLLKGINECNTQTILEALNQGADPNRQLEYEQDYFKNSFSLSTPLIAISSINYCADGVMLLLEYGADPNQPVLWEWLDITFFDLKFSYRMMGFFFEFGMDFLDAMLINFEESIAWDLFMFYQERKILNFEDEPGWTALHFAAIQGDLNMIETLLNYEADVNATGILGITPLMLSSYSGYTAAFETLIQNENLDLFQSTHSQTNALMFAAAGGHIEEVEVLKNKGIDVNSYNFYSYTPLMWASYYGHLEVVEYLVQEGADVNFVNLYGRNSLYYAKRKGHSDIIQFLEENGAQLINDFSDVDFY